MHTRTYKGTNLEKYRKKDIERKRKTYIDTNIYPHKYKHSEKHNTKSKENKYTKQSTQMYKQKHGKNAQLQKKN